MRHRFLHCPCGVHTGPSTSPAQMVIFGWGDRLVSRRLSGKEPACQCRRCEFDPWVGKIPWRRKWQPTPVLLLGKSHGQRSLVGYRPWGQKEVAITEWLSAHTSFLQWVVFVPDQKSVVCVCVYLYLYSLFCSIICSFTDATLSWWW